MNRRSMDDVMRLMLARYSGVKGFTGGDIERAMNEVCACSVHDIFERSVRGASPIDIDGALRLAGLRLVVSWALATSRDGTLATDFRIRATSAGAGAPARLVIFGPESVWGRAGLHTGDELARINGQAVGSWPELRRIVSAAKIGDTLTFEVRRNGAPVRARVVMSGYQRPSVRIEPVSNPSARQQAVLRAWLEAAAPRH